MYHNVTLILSRKALEQKDHVKYLGVFMDEHLNWSYHISHVIKKISRGIGILGRLRSFMKLNVLINIYYCLVYSYLAYGVQAWGSAVPTELARILILQKKAVRILSGNQYFQIYGEPAGPLPHAEPYFKKLEILKFQDIFEFNIANFVYATLAFESPSVFSDWFTYTHSIHTHATISSTTVNRREFFDTGTVVPTRTLFTKRSNLVNYGGKLIQVAGPILWNNLPVSIQDSASLSIFKKDLKNHLLSQYDTTDGSDDLRNLSNSPTNRQPFSNLTRDRPNPRHNFNQRWRQNVNQPLISRWDQDQDQDQ